MSSTTCIAFRDALMAFIIEIPQRDDFFPIEEFGQATLRRDLGRVPFIACAISSRKRKKMYEVFFLFFFMPIQIQFVETR